MIINLYDLINGQIKAINNSKYYSRIYDRGFSMWNARGHNYKHKENDWQATLISHAWNT